MAYVPDLIPAPERERYVRGDMGKRVGWGARPALLVVDVTPLAEVLEKLR